MSLGSWEGMGRVIALKYCEVGCCPFESLVSMLNILLLPRNKWPTLKGWHETVPLVYSRHQYLSQCATWLQPLNQIYSSFDQVLCAYSFDFSKDLSGNFLKNDVCHFAAWGAFSKTLFISCILVISLSGNLREFPWLPLQLVLWLTTSLMKNQESDRMLFGRTYTK